MSKQVVVLASGNPGKLRELEQLLGPLGVNLRPQSHWDTPEADENASTFLENALIKARNAAAHTGHAAIADDSGLVVPALGGRPGIRSARFSAEGTDAANNQRLLSELAALPNASRAAYFYCAMVFVDHAGDPAPLVTSAAWHGEILTTPRGDNGFGYDPLFFVPEKNCASAELAPAVKNDLSHRARAVRALRDALRARAGRES